MTQRPVAGDDAARDDALRTLYARRARSRVVRDCPTPESVEALVDGAGDESARLRTLDHVMACADCQPEFELLRSARIAAHDLGQHDNASETADVVALQEHFARRRRLPLAAAATLVLALAATALWRALDSSPRTAPLRGAAETITLVAPLTDARVPAGAALTFTWRSLMGATAYRLELLGDDGAAIVSVGTADTTHVLAESIVTGATAATQWRVEAVRSDGTRASSTLRDLRITP
jgi:hypothetical protein